MPFTQKSYNTWETTDATSAHSTVARHMPITAGELNETAHVANRNHVLVEVSLWSHVAYFRAPPRAEDDGTRFHSHRRRRDTNQDWPPPPYRAPTGTFPQDSLSPTDDVTRIRNCCVRGHGGPSRGIRTKRGKPMKYRRLPTRTTNQTPNPARHH